MNILVCTPGRMLQHLDQTAELDVNNLQILVLDEADRMLDMGFIHDIRRIMERLPERRQNLLFSATFPKEIRRLADSLLRNPRTIEITRRSVAAELVAQRVHHVAASRKRELLAHIVSSGNWRQVLIFTRTKHGANRLAEQLARGGFPLFDRA